MNTSHPVFTPLRIALITAIILSNGLALFSFMVRQQPWAEALGIFAIVFIMLFVFVILLELVWMHHRSKTVTDQEVRKKYRLAKLVYSILFVLGFMIAYLVLMT